jgi:hypothetical protein|nr:MAG TPA: hypothetical protein [Caudoviricetes sp.]
MIDYLIILLLLILIFKDFITIKVEKVEPKKETYFETEEVKKQKERKEEFDKLMNYSIDDAIQSKRK